MTNLMIKTICMGKILKDSGVSSLINALMAYLYQSADYMGCEYLSYSKIILLDFSMGEVCGNGNKSG